MYIIGRKKPVYHILQKVIRINALISLLYFFGDINEQDFSTYQINCLPAKWVTVHNAILFIGPTYLWCILEYGLASNVCLGGGYGVRVRVCYLLSLAYLTPKIFYLKLELLFILIYKDFCCVFLGLYDDFATKDVQKWILPKGDLYYNIW